MKDCKIITECLLCHGELKQIFSLGNTPLANEFVSDSNIEQDLFPLNLVQCKSCNHVQIDCIVDRERLFRNYYYVASTSPVNVKHFKNYANKVIDKFNLTKINFVVEIASNDGCMLRNFQEKDIRILGIDPARNIAEQANKEGILTIPEFFGPELAVSIREDHGLADVVICNNMLAHNENITDIIVGVKKILTYDGSFIFENSYLLDICDKTLIDLAYHEHIHHHSITPLISFFDKQGMDIYEVERLPNHGGSIRVYTCFKGAKTIDKSVGELVELERDINIKLERLNDKVKKLGKQLRSKLEEIKAEGKTIAVYGMPAKATTILYALDIDETMIDFAVDDAKLKQGTFSPGKHITVLPVESIYERKPDFLLVLAWNFADSIIKNHKKFLDNGGSFIVPLPELKVISCERETK